MISLASSPLFSLASVHPAPSPSDEFLDIFQPNFFHIIAISETCLKSHILSSLISVTSYLFLCHDRDQTSGGIGLFCSRISKSKILLTSLPFGSPYIKCLFVETSSTTSCLLFAVIYFPNSHIPYTYESTLLNLFSSYSNIIRACDFKTDLQSHSPERYVTLLHLCHSLNLHIFPFQPTTLKTCIPGLIT